MCEGIRRKIWIGCCLVWGWLLLCAGCTEQQALPVIVDNPSAPRLVRLPAVRTEPGVFETPQPSGNIPRVWFPPSNVERSWQAIVIHHSATDTGNAAVFDKWHRENRNWDGVGYDFVIGNGTDSGDGRVEVTFRWREQRTGAHCKTPNNWANEQGIGICLVGNFDQSVPTRRQMQSLLRLVGFLQKRYGIPKSRIYGHKDTPGARVTHCPGKNFPMWRFKSALD